MMPPKRFHIEKAVGYVSSFFLLSYVYSPLCLASCLGYQKRSEGLFIGPIYYKYLSVTSS